MILGIIQQQHYLWTHLTGNPESSGSVAPGGGGGLSASGEPLAVQTGPPLGCLPLLWLRTNTGERFRSLPMMLCKCTDGFRALYSQRRSQE